MLRKFMIALVATLTFMASMPEAQAFGFRSTRAARASDANAPLAYQLYCLQYPSDCRKSRRSVVAYTPRIRALLVSVNNRVNRSIRPRSDKGETWSLNSAYGDFALDNPRKTIVRRQQTGYRFLQMG